ncbi:MAG: hypothetical protein JWO98_1273 [Frankiales bacterium]|nr:hypothetical protein [Frankiales bacterium]
MPAKKARPTPADHAALNSDTAHKRPCPRCSQPTLVALVGRVAALAVRADPEPLGPLEEIHAHLTGRTTYCLRQHPFLPTRLLDRDRWHIASGNCTHLVVADHQCPPIHIQETLL